MRGPRPRRRAVGGERERHRAVDDAQRALDRRRERARAEEEGEAAELGDLGDEERRLPDGGAELPRRHEEARVARARRAPEQRGEARTAAKRPRATPTGRRERVSASSAAAAATASPRSDGANSRVRSDLSAASDCGSICSRILRPSVRSVGVGAVERERRGRREVGARARRAIARHGRPQQAEREERQ